MKLLPIKINDNIEYMLDFEHGMGNPDTFIISSKSDGNTICEFYPYNNGVTFQEASKVELYLGATPHLGKPNEQDGLNIDYVLTINLGREPVNLGNTPEITCDNLRICYKDNVIKILENVQNAIGIAIDFHIDNCKQRIVVYVAPEGQIRDAVIDSGSESSQMAIFKRNDNGSGNEYSERNIYDIMNGVYRFFENKSGSIDNPDDKNRIINSYQSEGNGSEYECKLFKSVFFAKKSIEETPDHVYIKKEDIKEEKPLMKLYTSKEKESAELIQECYIQLCNMKISSFTGIPVPTVTYGEDDIPTTEFCSTHENYYYRRHINLFSYLILQNLCGINNQGGETQRKAKLLSLYILMPNVFSASKVRKYIDFIKGDINDLIENTDSFKEKIKGVSVTAVSESDASLMGIFRMNINNGWEEGKYLIMDAGKGTIDFSIVEYRSADSTHYSLMRGGVVGASAAISYGLLLDLIQTYVEMNGFGCSVQEYIYRVILGHDIAGSEKIEHAGERYYIQRMMDAVDRYKMRYSNLLHGEISERYSGNISEDLPIDKFTEWINGYQYKVKGKYVNAIIDTMVNRVIEKLKNELGGVKYVMFAGRGFKFEGLKNKMFDKLKGINKAIKLVEIGVHGGTLTEKNVCLFIPDTIYNGKNKLLSLYIETNNNGYKTGLIRERGKTSKISAMNFVDGGLFTGQKGLNEINGSQYRLDHDGYTNGNIFCNGKGQFLVRAAGGNDVITLREVNEIGNVSLAFPSLFPNWKITKIDEIYIPEINAIGTNNEDGESSLSEVSNHFNEAPNDKQSEVLDHLEDSGNDTDKTPNGTNVIDEVFYYFK